MPRNIKAAISPGRGAPPVIRDVVLADPAPDELVIEVKAAGVCHTDIGISGWAESPGVYGHEGAGVVVECGRDVTAFKPGDRVVATFGYCGQCRNCDDEHPAYCFDNIALNIEGKRGAGPALSMPDGTPISSAFFQQSSFATHALITQRNAVKIPGDLDFVTAAPLGCGIQTGAGAVMNNFAAKPGRPLLVIGCGAVGLSAIMAGKIAGCAPIIAIDIVAERLDMASDMGADNILAGDDAGLAEKIAELSGGISYALDTAGRQETFELALASLHPGGSIGVLTIPGAFDQPVPHPGGIAFMTTNMLGIIEGDSVPDIFIPWLIEQRTAGALPYDRMIETFAFEDIADALKAQELGKVIKPVLVFE